MTSSTSLLEQRAPVRAAPPGWIVWALRVTATGHLIGVLGQAVLAGMFVTGDVDLLAWHRDNAGFTYVLLFLQLVAAVLLWRPARFAGWPALATLGLVVAETAQVALGNARIIAAHFPLGMAIFGMSAVVTVWTWRGLRTAGGAA
ncbi:hypothetical protein [Nonomuraea maritima]|nr:hypothetical protein [Nonomuraea maritima]